MDKRFLIAVALAIGVVYVTPKIFPPPAMPIADTTATKSGAPDSVASSAAATAPASSATPQRPAQRVDSTLAPAMRVDTASVETPLAIYRFSSVGASMIGAA